MVRRQLLCTLTVLLVAFPVLTPSMADDVVWKTVTANGVNHDVHVVSTGPLGSNFPNAALTWTAHEAQLRDIYVIDRSTGLPLNKPQAKNLVTILQSSFKWPVWGPAGDPVLFPTETIYAADVRQYLSHPYPLLVPNYLDDWWIDSFIRGGLEGLDNSDGRKEAYRQLLFDMILQPDAVPDLPSTEYVYSSIADRLGDVPEAAALLGAELRIFEIANDDTIDFSSFRNALRTLKNKTSKLMDVKKDPPQAPTPLERMSAALDAISIGTRISGACARVMLLETLAHERALQRIRITEAFIDRARAAGGPYWDPMLDAGFQQAKIDINSYIDGYYSSIGAVVTEAFVSEAGEVVLVLSKYMARIVDKVFKTMNISVAKVALPYQLSWQVYQGIRRQKNRASLASLAVTLQRHLFEPHGLEWHRDRMRVGSLLDAHQSQDFLELYQMQWYLGFKFYLNTEQVLGNSLSYWAGAGLDIFFGVDYFETINDIRRSTERCLVITKQTAPTGYLATTTNPVSLDADDPELVWLLNSVRDTAPPTPSTPLARDLTICITMPNDNDGDPQTAAIADGVNIYFVPYPCDESEGNFSRSWECSSADADGTCQARVQLFYDDDRDWTNRSETSGPWQIEGAQSLNPSRSPFLWVARNQGIERGQFWILAVISDGDQVHHYYSTGYYDFDYTPIYETGKWQVVAVDVEESSPSDGDSIPEVGEDVRVWLTMRNVSNRTLTGPRMRDVLLLDEPVKYQSRWHDERLDLTEVLDGMSNFPDTAPGAEVRALDSLRLHTAPLSPPTIDLVGGMRYMDRGEADRPNTERREVLPFTVRLSNGESAPHFWCRDTLLSDDDDHDGTLESGENGSFFVTLCNDGTWQGSDLEGRFDDIPQIGEWINELEFYPDIAPADCEQSLDTYGVEAGPTHCGHYDLAMTVFSAEGGNQYPVYCPLTVTCVPRQSIEDDVDASNVPQGTELSVSIRLSSTGAAMLHVSEVYEKNGATDTTIESYPSSLPAGERGEIIVTIDTTDLPPGRYTRVIRTESDADNTDEHESLISFGIGSVSIAEQISFAGADDEYDISGDILVFARSGDIYMIRMSTKEETNLTATPAWSEFDPRVDGNRVVFIRRIASDQTTDVVLLDLESGQETQITDHPANQYDPDVFGDTIVWEDQRNDVWQTDLYSYRIGSSPTNGVLELDLGAGYSARDPRIEEGFIAFSVGHHTDPTAPQNCFPDFGYKSRSTGAVRRLGLEGGALCFPGDELDLFGCQMVFTCECRPDCNNDDMIYNVNMCTNSAPNRLTCDATLTSDRESPSILDDEVLYSERGTDDIFSVAIASGCQPEVPQQTGVDVMKVPVAEPRIGTYAFMKMVPEVGRYEYFAVIPPPAVDASISSFDFDDELFVQERSYAYHVRVQNGGQELLTDLTVSVASDGTVIDSFSVAALAPGASTLFDGSWSTGVSAGSHVLRAFLDPAPPRDGRPANNAREKTNEVTDDDVDAPVLTPRAVLPGQPHDGDVYIEAGEGVEFRWAARDQKGIAETHVLVGGNDYPGSPAGDEYVALASPHDIGVFTAGLFATDADDSPASSGPVPVSYEVYPSRPSVIDVDPDDGAFDVPHSASVSAVFDVDMDPATVTVSTFVLSGSAGEVISGDVLYDVGTRIATFTPTASLPANASVAATLRGGDGGVRDVRQNALLTDFVWHFTTFDDGVALPSRFIDFGPAAIAPANGYERDSGLPFASERGFGWTQGNVESRARSCAAQDPRRQTFIFARPERRWELELPNGNYDVEVSVGDCLYPQGPQRIATEGVQLVVDETTPAGSFIARTWSVPVRDGRLTVVVGGGAGNTVLNYVSVVPAATQPNVLKSINFQPEGASAPTGFDRDAGRLYSAALGRGWDRDLSKYARERGRHNNKLLDTFVYVAGDAATFELAVPSGDYDVSLAAGDPSYEQGPHRIRVEGKTVVDDETTTANAFIERTARVTVTDGRLTVVAGGTSGNTVLNSLSLAAARTEFFAVNFQPPASIVPAGYTADSGAPYSAGRQYGWSGSGTIQTRERDRNADQRLDTFAYVGSASKTWEASVPNGDYEVQFACGDPSYPQGPHWMSIEGNTVLGGERTTTGQFITKVARVAVRDGRLSIGVGGGATGFTTLNFLLIRPVSYIASVNFQPEVSAVPLGYLPDAGKMYSDAVEYGWESNAIFLQRRSRDRNLVADQALDTFVYSSVAERWRMSIPNGSYRVSVAVGDAAYSQGPQRVLIEGCPLVDGETTSPGEFLIRTECVHVADGNLSMEIGGLSGKNTTLNYIRAYSATCDPASLFLDERVRSEQATDTAPPDLTPLN